jgi:hypothetical protein
MAKADLTVTANEIKIKTINSSLNLFFNSIEHLDVLSSAVTANDVQLMFNFVAGTDAISWNIVVLPCRAFFLVGNLKVYLIN